MNLNYCFNCGQCFYPIDMIMRANGTHVCVQCVESNQRGPRPNRDTTQWALACLLADQQDEPSVLQMLPNEIFIRVATYLQKPPWVLGGKYGFLNFTHYTAGIVERPKDIYIQSDI